MCCFNAAVLHRAVQLSEDAFRTSPFAHVAIKKSRAFVCTIQQIGGIPATAVTDTSFGLGALDLRLKPEHFFEAPQT